jgi:hypothetical protein
MSGILGVRGSLPGNSVWRKTLYQKIKVQAVRERDSDEKLDGKKLKAQVCMSTR